MKTCEICKRTGDDDKYFEKHHLTPGDKKSPTIIVCQSCGDIIHKLFPNNKLKTKLNTLEKLLAEEKIQNWINFIVDKPLDKKIPMAKKKRKK